MIAWVRPIKYDVTADRGIIMNKESSYEMGIEDNTGNLQGAFNSGKYADKKPGSTGCWYVHVDRSLVWVKDQPLRPKLVVPLRVSTS